ncbi:uncharacterized protein LOC131879840 [Tigriopus californicus]|uniref:uncharacterized protein LOC131879840 n=1 Tax=Tigriopus californicus TaxID=6832 RepID=UPI0027DA1EB5|nr:uncharacterized protein LOC131879840 [Tigriopus californicus]
MCFRTSLFAQKLTTVSRSTWRVFGSRQHQQCLACLFVFLSVLTELTGLPNHGSAAASVGLVSAGSKSQRQSTERVSFYSNVSLPSQHYQVLPDWSVHYGGSHYYGGHYPPRTPHESARILNSGSASLPNSASLPSSHSISSSGSQSTNSPPRDDRGQPASGSQLESDIPGPWPWAPAPIRHWWAQHHKRSAISSLSSTSSSSSYSLSSSELQQNQQCLHNHTKFQKIPALTIQGELPWAKRVCSASSLDDRVKLLLAESPCKQHKVCQVLSPTDLQRISSDATCLESVRDKWWELFRKINNILIDFEEIFSKKFAIERYSVIHAVEECKAAYAYWTCSTHLPLYLTPSIGDERPSTTQKSSSFNDSHTSFGSGDGPEDSRSGSESSDGGGEAQSERRPEAVPLNGCGSICREVERKCPFFIKGLEDDKAAGNPSFICKDEAIPNVIINPMGDEAEATLPLCCYKAVDEPPPGAWLSFEAEDPTRPFCVEPDSIRDRRRSKRYTSSTTSNLDSGQPDRAHGLGGPSHSHPASSSSSSSSYSYSSDTLESSTFSSDDLDLEESITLLSGRDDEMRCDIIFSPPSLSLNITSVALDEWEAWHHTLSNTSIFGATDTYFDDEDEGDLLFASLSRWWSNFMGRFGLSIFATDSAGHYGVNTSGQNRTSSPGRGCVWALVALILWLGNTSGRLRTM